MTNQQEIEYQPLTPPPSSLETAIVYGLIILFAVSVNAMIIFGCIKLIKWAWGG